MKNIDKFKGCLIGGAVETIHTTLNRNGGNYGTRKKR